MYLRHRGQALLPHGLWDVLWELSLLAIAVYQAPQMLDVPPSSRASLAPTWTLGCSVGAELARDSGVSVTTDAGCTSVIAGKPCSHMDSGMLCGS
ncbi:hypothetical protein F7R20_26845 [Pseudomonas brassicacearum subsp. brassicacearum]|nr:hypothetical protein F7R20_26845 [Pseudomonas brassicacearum subsp. brassicacearum]QEO81067.1 hypothetical protein ELZ14_27305 [Pseudomonas brassicacearum]